MHFNLFRCSFLQMKGQLMAISKIEKYFFQFWVFWAKIDNAQNDPKTGNFHGTRTRVLKDTRCRIIWQMNAFEIYFVHLHYYLNLSIYILSRVKSSNPPFGPENSPKMAQKYPKIGEMLIILRESWINTRQFAFTLILARGIRLWSLNFQIFKYWPPTAMSRDQFRHQNTLK